MAVVVTTDQIKELMRVTFDLDKVEVENFLTLYNTVIGKAIERAMYKNPNISELVVDVPYLGKIHVARNSKRDNFDFQSSITFSEKDQSVIYDVLMTGESDLEELLEQIWTNKVLHQVKALM